MTTFIRVRSAEGPTDEYLVGDAELAANPDAYVVINPVDVAAPTIVDAAAPTEPAPVAAPEPSVGDSNEEGAA